ncbi:helix-turn-helix domain-containing protein [Lysinibacillus xylanilyticus]|uniref:helix-turn-helix domain-containing protein n=1 Tax=Lysinibacillus xylanilyticus TaxID=582475 RepID=UPI003D04187B
MKNNLIALSIFSLAICFVLGSWLISNSLNSDLPQETEQLVQNQLLSQSEIADYLGITIEEVQKLTKVKEGENGYRHIIPFIEICDKIYYPKKAVDERLINVIAETVY